MTCLCRNICVLFPDEKNYFCLYESAQTHTPAGLLSFQHNGAFYSQQRLIMKRVWGGCEGGAALLTLEKCDCDLIWSPLNSETKYKKSPFSTVYRWFCLLQRRASLLFVLFWVRDRFSWTSSALTANVSKPDSMRELTSEGSWRKGHYHKLLLFLFN